MLDMCEVLKGIRYRSLDEARKALQGLSPTPENDIFDDGGEEPQGLLSVITEDLVEEEFFYRLFDGEAGVLVEVERIRYSGFGPPAEESAYMGFVTLQRAYVLMGRRLAVGIDGCPDRARDLHELEAQVLDGQHPLDRDAVSRAFKLSKDWDFEELLDRISGGSLTAQEVDDLIHGQGQAERVKRSKVKG